MIKEEVKKFMAWAKGEIKLTKEEFTKLLPSITDKQRKKQRESLARGLLPFDRNEDE